MHLRFSLKIDRVKGRTYGRLVRSVREGKRVRPITLVQLGRITEEQIPRIRAWLATDPTLPQDPRSLLSDLGQVRIRHSWQYGREALAHFLWRKLGLHTIVVESLSNLPGKARQARWIETMVVNRLAEPTSKYGLLDWLELSATPFLLELGNGKRHENLFYRAMDRLISRQDALERRVYERVVRPLTTEPAILYHDLTSTYCERDEEGLVRFGYNRDGVDSRPQVNWGMVVTPEGFPITMEVYPGNTKDDTTVRGMRDRLEQVFDLHEGVYVGDRGMRTKDIVADLTGHGFHYILAERNSSKVAQEALTLAQKVKPVKVSESNVAREVVTADGARHVVLLNEKRRREELEILEHRQAEGKAILTRWRWRVGKLHHHEILKGAQAELRKAGLQDLFDLGFDEDSFQGLTSEWKVRVERTKAWAGWWVLSTDTDLPVEEVARLYQGLTVIERGWRELKGVLEVRPLHHRLDRRIRAHLLICELAYLLDRYVDWSVRKAQVQERGTLVSGPRAMERFESILLNETELATTGLKRLIVTELQSAHEEILRAIGVDKGAFQQGWNRLD